MTGITKRRRTLLTVIGILLVLLALPVTFVLRATVFAPHYDVASIASSESYKSPALLERAWSLPVAATFGGRVVYQSNGSVCGPDSLANIFRSLGEQAATQDAVLSGTGRCSTGMCIMGLTLDEVADVARQKTSRQVTVVRDLSIDDLRAHLRKTNDVARRYLVNFHRGLLFGKGHGHHSPIAGYLETDDLAFVLDVNEKFGPWLVSTERLFKAIDSVDSSSGKKRGLLVFE